MNFDNVFSKEEIYLIGKYFVENAEWHRVDNENKKVSRLSLEFPHNTDLSSVGARVDALIDIIDNK